MIEIYGATETGGIGSRTEADGAFHLLPHLARQADAAIDQTSHAILDVQDRLDWIGDTDFHVLGRKDDVVQVGGVNVSLAQVATVIRRMEGVVEVAIRPGQDRLRAFIVPADATSPGLEQFLRNQIAQALPAPARPVSLRFGGALPRNSMGKLCDWPEGPQSG